MPCAKKIIAQTVRFMLSMAPPGRRTGPVASDPYQAASRLLLYLKLKVAAVKTDPSSRFLRDATKAAEELEGCMASLESGPPALQLALAQVGEFISVEQPCCIRVLHQTSMR
jgi:hypothetical protein